MGSRTFLIGGGWEPGAAPALYGPFLRAAAGAGGDRDVAPRVGCLVLDEGDGDAQFARYDGVLRSVADCTPVPLLVPLGKRFDPAVLEDVDGLLVCGGLTPAYQDAFAGRPDGDLRDRLAARRIPYAGFSAGAALAARDAVVGGWLDDGVPVCPEDSAEDLEEVEVRAGLGLVPFTVDVHAAQWGTLPRLIGAVARHRLSHGVAIDENTLVEVDEAGRARVTGRGRAHSVRPAAAAEPAPGSGSGSGSGSAPDGGALVRSYRAGESFRTG